MEGKNKMEWGQEKVCIMTLQGDGHPCLQHNSKHITVKQQHLDPFSEQDTKLTF